MFVSLFILLAMPFLDTARIRGCQFRPMFKIFFWAFLFNFLILMWIGSLHPNSPFVEIGQITTAFYFIWFVFIVPIMGALDNTLIDLASSS